MPETYFSEREQGPRPQTETEISVAVWGGIAADLLTRVGNGSFGLDYPEDCPDYGRGTIGTNTDTMGLAVKAEVPEAPWPFDAKSLPPTIVILDVLEFCWEHVAEPIERDFHPYFGHSHLTFNREAGRTAFVARINRIFSRNGVAFRLTEQGRIERVIAKELEAALTIRHAATGDAELDRLLVEATRRFLDPHPEARRDALEKLWDAWERLKTLPAAANKKESARVLLDSAASEPAFRQVLETEARALTEIGNQFRIRHSETQQIPLERAEQADYLFVRLASLLRLLLFKIIHVPEPTPVPVLRAGWDDDLPF